MRLRHLATAAHVRAVADAARAAGPDGVVLVVGHSNTVPAIVGALGGPTLPDLCDTQYATMFVVTLHGEQPPSVARVTFGAPDAADAACPAMVVPPER
jgi:broad specificity phosphatase PhoE